MRRPIAICGRATTRELGFDYLEADGWNGLLCGEDAAT